PDPARRARPAQAAAVDDPVGCHDQVDRHVVPGHGYRAGRTYLQLVDGGDHDRVRADQPGRTGERELEIGETTALSQPGTVLADGHASGDDQVDRYEIGQRDAPGRAARTPDRGGRTRAVREMIGVEEEERFGLGQPWHGHVHDLAVLQRALTYRQLCGVGVGLDGTGANPSGC